jgi:hypothetical protein
MDSFTNVISSSLALFAMTMGLAAGGCAKESPVIGEDLSAYPSVPRTVHYVTRALPLDAGSEKTCIDGRVPLPTSFGSSCLLLSVARGASTCPCDGPGLALVSGVMKGSLLRDAGLSGGNTGSKESDYCVCQVMPAVNDDLAACENDVVVPTGATGWCAMSPDRGWGSPEVAAECGARPMLRLLGDARPTLPDATFVLACLGGETLDFATPAVKGDLGDACIPSLEGSVEFPGFHALDLAVETKSPACDSGVCLANHFQGRASCPYGQTRDEAEGSPACFVPGSDAPIVVPVAPQLLSRPADRAAICTCRCDGPDPAFEYCECPSDMTCADGPNWVGQRGDYGDVTVKFCVPKGTEYDATKPSDANVCDKNLTNCGDPRPF